jgi:hypothetical protein
MPFSLFSHSVHAGRSVVLTVWWLACGGLIPLSAAPPATATAPVHPLRFIDTSMESGSPLWWEIDDAGVVHAHLTYDQERLSTNRANGHWLFRIEAEPGADLTLDLGPFGNVWNGTLTNPVWEATITFVSDDGKQWRPVKLEPAGPFRVRMKLKMKGESLHVARLEPYRLSELERFKQEIAGHPMVEIRPLGQTVQGQELELVRVGNPAAPKQVLIRARAHPWEPGGNWVVEGLVRRLLCGDAEATRYLERYCLYIQPMANKDGVRRGMTRFNLRGKDLNRQWDRPADPALAPENAALESWIEGQIATNKRPDLMLDFHNDANGTLHISRPEMAPAALADYLSRMERLETVLRLHTWFTEGSSQSSFRNPGSIGEGLLSRYGISAVVHELNANWIAGLNDYPYARHWVSYGEQFATALFHFFEE